MLRLLILQNCPQLCSLGPLIPKRFLFATTLRPSLWGVNSSIQRGLPNQASERRFPRGAAAGFTFMTRGRKFWKHSSVGTTYVVHACRETLGRQLRVWPRSGTRPRCLRFVSYVLLRDIPSFKHNDSYFASESDRGLKGFECTNK